MPLVTPTAAGAVQGGQATISQHRFHRGRIGEATHGVVDDVRNPAMFLTALAFAFLPTAHAGVPPTPPESVDYTWADADSIILSWDPPSLDAGGVLDHYEVHQVHNGEGLPPENVAPTTPKTSFQIDGIAAPGIYTFYVIAVDVDGDRSLPSAPVVLALEYPHCSILVIDLEPVWATAPHLNCLFPPP